MSFVEGEVLTVLEVVGAVVSGAMGAISSLAGRMDWDGGHCWPSSPVSSSQLLELLLKTASLASFHVGTRLRAITLTLCKAAAGVPATFV